jgi:hypothetical protein
MAGAFGEPGMVRVLGIPMSHARHKPIIRGMAGALVTIHTDPDCKAQ